MPEAPKAHHRNNTIEPKPSRLSLAQQIYASGAKPSQTYTPPSLALPAMPTPSVIPPTIPRMHHIHRSKSYRASMYVGPPMVVVLSTEVKPPKDKDAHKPSTDAAGKTHHQSTTMSPPPLHLHIHPAPPPITPRASYPTPPNSTSTAAHLHSPQPQSHMPPTSASPPHAQGVPQASSTYGTYYAHAQQYYNAPDAAAQQAHAQAQAQAAAQAQAQVTQQRARARAVQQQALAQAQTQPKPSSTNSNNMRNNTSTLQQHAQQAAALQRHAQQQAALQQYAQDRQALQNQALQQQALVQGMYGQPQFQVQQQVQRPQQQQHRQPSAVQQLLGAFIHGFPGSLGGGGGGGGGGGAGEGGWICRAWEGEGWIGRACERVEGMGVGVLIGVGGIGIRRGWDD
ncbi:hypothetical protein DXG01_008975 [Tephrocybe rancida]|nr:hypothetical protein DXG01_008975 [Tephrocybe rancida]